jgi:hypothetical protein
MKRTLLLFAVLLLPAGSQAAREGDTPVELVTAGTLTELGVSGRLLLGKRVAPAARDVAFAMLP